MQTALQQAMAQAEDRAQQAEAAMAEMEEQLQDLQADLENARDVIKVCSPVGNVIAS